MTETEHQILLMCWAKKMALAGRKELDLLFHIPNGGGRSKREGMTFKAMGVKSGVSDLFLPVMRTKFCVALGGLWIEMKGEKGAVSDDQWKWIYAMRRNGYEAVACFGWERAMADIKAYLGGEWPEVDMSEMEGRLCGSPGGSVGKTGDSGDSAGKGVE